MRKHILFAAALMLLLTDVTAQNLPNGAFVYALPQTTLSVTVEASREIFTAGPYAQYAEKYLGTAARSGNSSTCTIKSISLTPYLEADPSERYAITLPEKSTAAASFLRLCSQGLVIMSDSYTGRVASWRFPSPEGAEAFIGKDPSGGLSTATTTLFKAVRTAQGFQRVAVQQAQVVENSLEKKAMDAAESIFNLRTRRIEIITGDTDATFSGEALKAAVDEIGRLEEEYLSLFYGFTEEFSQIATFDIVPKAAEAKQVCTAFRVSDTEGILPASAANGDAVILELTAEKLSEPTSTFSKAKEGNMVFYRVPAIAVCRLTDGPALLLESRVPVYQLGEKLQFPIDVLTTR